jgi:phage shock protein C
MKRLYKSRKYKVIDGVCGGIAEYFNVDPVLVRLIAILLCFTGGVAVVAYIVGMIIIPRQPLEWAGGGEVGQAQTAVPSPQAEEARRTGGLILGILMMALGAYFLLNDIPYFHRYYWWLWGRGWQFIWPSLLIVLGLIIILALRDRTGSRR